METRDFPIAVIVSLSSGVMLAEGWHEAAEFLMGHPIWSHQFARKELWEEMQKTILEQCPGLPTGFCGINANNVPARIAALEKEFGPTVKIRKGSGLTAMLPTDEIPNHLKDKTAIIKI